VTRLLATKARDGRVACGQPSCRKVLPGVLRMRTMEVRWLFLGVGWTWDDHGVWQLTQRAQDNRDFMAMHRDDARRHEADEGASTREPVAVADGAEGFRPRGLPIDIVCPHCGSIQSLAPSELDLDTFRDSNAACGMAGCPDYAVRLGLCAKHQGVGAEDAIDDHAVVVAAIKRDIDTL
jgi:hypothetical protein